MTVSAVALPVLAPLVACPGLRCAACGAGVAVERAAPAAWAWIHAEGRPAGCPGLVVPLAEVNYLLHFTPPYRHARHYLGFTDDLPRRLRRQATGQGARLVAVALAAGCSFELVWVRLGSRDEERRLKNQKAVPRLVCPVCPGPARRPAAVQGRLVLDGGG
jgi:hypothetical protein